MFTFYIIYSLFIWTHKSELVSLVYVLLLSLIVVCINN